VEITPCTAKRERELEEKNGKQKRLWGGETFVDPVFTIEVTTVEEDEEDEMGASGSAEIMTTVTDKAGSRTKQ
jgi:hypothetical protein